MELQQLLNLKNPTLTELEQTEALLQGLLDKNHHDLVALDAEDLAQAASRLCGSGECAETRRAARDKLVSNSADVSHVLAGVQAKLATERARQADEREAEAWDKTWGHLARRRAAIGEIDKLLDRVAALYGQAADAYQAATATAPRKPETRAFLLPGHNDLPKALVVALNSRLGFPYPVGNDHALETAMRIHGLPAYLVATENYVMCAPVLNPDSGPVPALDGGKAAA